MLLPYILKQTRVTICEWRLFGSCLLATAGIDRVNGDPLASDAHVAIFDSHVNVVSSVGHACIHTSTLMLAPSRLREEDSQGKESLMFTCIPSSRHMFAVWMVLCPSGP